MADRIDEFIDFFRENPSLQDLIRQDSRTLEAIRSHPEIIDQMKNTSIEDMQKTMHVIWPVIRDILNEREKIKTLEKITDIDKEYLSSVVFVTSFIDNLLIKDLSADVKYNEILSLVRRAKFDESLFVKISEIYSANKIESLSLLQARILELEKKFYGNQYENINKIKESNNNDKLKIVEKIVRKLKEDKKEEYDSIERLKFDIHSLKNDLFLKITKYLVSNQTSDKLLDKRIAAAIYQPFRLSLNYYITDEKYSSLPIQWSLNQLPVSTAIALLRIHKDGKDISNYFAGKYKNGFKEIEACIGSRYMSPPYSLMICCKKNAIKESLRCYKKKWHYPAMCGLLALIEGSIWTFAEFVNRTSKNTQKILEQENDTQKISAIINKKDGTKNTNISIGTLLNISRMNDILDEKFIRFFCDEFYNERNLIMHGDNWNEADITKTAKKIAVLEYILLESEKYIKNFWINHYKTIWPEAYLDDLYLRIMKSKQPKKTNK